MCKKKRWIIDLDIQICQNMYDFGEISLSCLTKYAIFFFELVKLWQIIKYAHISLNSIVNYIILYKILQLKYR
jgi:hypothetical protein